MAKTYGQASAAALAERQANGEPLKWRKFVSYAEFTPPHTPVEGHHIPGYSGHVPGVYAENLYAKTYGKTTLQAVGGEFPKGCEQLPDEQARAPMFDYHHVGLAVFRPRQWEAVGMSRGSDEPSVLCPNVPEAGLARRRASEGGGRARSSHRGRSSHAAGACACLMVVSCDAHPRLYTHRHTIHNAQRPHHACSA